MRLACRSSAKEALSEWSMPATAGGHCLNYRLGCPECGTTNFGRSKHWVQRTRSSHAPVLKQARTPAKPLTPCQLAPNHQRHDFVGSIRNEQHPGVPEQLLEPHFVADTHRAMH